MANRANEDEKNERIIRSLLKLPENRRCINCNSLGPQYVCSNFWTFVCTNCSGIHREFTHRVKSVSMAKFTSQEVAALQEGGNQRAKEILFKEWDPQCQSFPDSSNVERLRDFIKHVYVDRRFTGDRNFDKPPKGKLGEREDVNENRRVDAYQGGSRSPPYEDTYERRYSDRSSPGGRSDERRSLGYEENRQYNDYKRSPARPEVVNDWRREDRFGNGMKLEDHRTSDGDPKLGGWSPERRRDFEASSSPVVRPVREILGENIIRLRISEPPKANLGKAADCSEPTRKTASSSSLGPANGKPAEVKLETTGSLIDFDDGPELTLTAPAPQAEITVATQFVAQPSSSNNENNWASFDFAPKAKSSQAPSNMNPLESVLSELSGPASVPGHMSAIPSIAGVSVAESTGNLTVLPITGASTVLPVGHMPVLPFNGGASAAVPGMVPTVSINGISPAAKVTDAGQWPSIQQHQQPSLFPAAGSQSATQQINPLVNGAPGIQAVQGPLNTPATAAPQPVSKPAQEVASVGLSEPSAEEKSIERKALPEDLFAPTYPYFPARVPGWQTGPPHGVGYSMQYNTTVPMPTFFQTSKSTNPFDLNNEPSPVHLQTFPSMASLQGTLPSLPPSSGLMRTSSLGAPSPSWPSSQPSPYPLAIPIQGPTFAKTMPLRPYMVQPTTQVPNNMQLSGHQGIGGYSSEGAGFGSVNMDQRLAGRFSAPPTPQPFSSVGGNPFG
ncbi:probable ADP-ribosylation factor GTPase-activating protein AGD14 isoform X2 [Tripterygium wilfordii]|uniref:probable ADP-ribosylation factor GTPase-activating protein AGD14 isoform X2 n=1 Tax=Tripterygium wilfordii TaxID=458696 RepID=UPI0018F81B9D|nr:probable ADP-ribosylation factor GTPase-activating protein AGD14 isoform X2 [Tripterygium wilfordii]